MNVLSFSSPCDVSAEALFSWHARRGAFERLVPPWAPVRLERFDGILEGDRAVLRIGPGPLALRWVAEHHDVIEGRQFCDRQVQGPFAYWDHTHRFEPVASRESEASTLVDRIEYEMPGGAAGSFLDRWLEPELRRQFAYRHRITARDVALHQRYTGGTRSLRVAVSGASGLIGSQLTAFLSTGGHDVRRLVRSGPARGGDILWNPDAGMVDTPKLEGMDAVVHLAGEPVTGVWTDAKKRRIRDSRVGGTRLLAEALAGLDDPPSVFLSASGVSYYGDHGGAVITEDSRPQDAGFLGSVAEAWERATAPAAEAGIRTVQARIGMVLSPAGGLLAVHHPLFWFGLGGTIGPPDTYLPWVLLDDVIGGLYHVLWTDEVEGPVNVTAPNPASMGTYAETLGRVLNRPVRLKVPASILRSLVGEFAEETVLKSLRVRPMRLRETGYTFAFDRLASGLRHVLGRISSPRSEGSLQHSASGTRV